MITFGRKLKHLRQKNHLTQKELGDLYGFYISPFSSYPFHILILPHTI